MGGWVLNGWLMDNRMGSYLSPLRKIGSIKADDTKDSKKTLKAE